MEIIKVQEQFSYSLTKKMTFKEVRDKLVRISICYISIPLLSKEWVKNRQEKDPSSQLYNTFISNKYEALVN
jgi:hypothetical protein